MRKPLLSALAVVLASCASTRAAPDPTAVNPSQPHAVGDPVYVNGGGGPVDAALMTGVAAGAAVVQRHQGGCYATCPPGTACNTANGLCEELPCHGRCDGNQYCDTSGPFPKCVGAGEVDLKIKKDP
jgi:hypothetical protein